jgi:hypothetical protein
LQTSGGGLTMGVEMLYILTSHFCEGAGAIL